ncbi:MAG TPA: serine hydrolase domain-containing protein [Methylomirabilota bacterium]|nr:serine hydrolase domain-containing protein [Methylomirabilota bacterium]
MLKRALLLSLVVLLVVPVVVRAQPSAAPETVGMSKERLARIGQALNGQIEAKSFPGAVVLVARKGRIAYFESFGQLDPKTGSPMTKDAIFRLYSMTKPFTSVAAMMLVEDGKLRLGDPVGMYLPQLAKLEVAVQGTDTNGKPTYTVVAAERPVTIYDLLRHTSGLVYGGFTRNEYVKDLYAKNNVGWASVTPSEQLEALAKAPLARQPGTAWEYSLSTDVVGRVVESVSGVPLGRFLDDRVFRPLGMSDTTFHLPADKVKRLAQPLATDRATGKPIVLHDVTVAPKNDAGGAGAAGSTADYGRFVQMLANGGQLDGKRLLAATTVRHMTSDHLGDIKPAIPLLAPGYGFGLGFAVRRADGLNGLPGSAGEYNWGGAAGTGFWIDPKEQLVAVLMTQAQPGAWQREFRDLFRQLVYQAIID